ncbi:hypothetical protein EMIHUDRAFT_211931 [Emiliania huxleyi CCMP1516]|uniref:Neurotransmitter-gated ion-channel ligand-binding domain-containing protein n=2 Tax=Emiliania huxleyi TaxID=2903 RepID=A0A0D3IT74_EMIH1|nr:hypothetical protein EMIHUDRAFT_211931 [Emiliania huxleyi CCMP1516]EOD14459.1 hypothetical protein EMIHUDRAFT_211931 [Emiliania huxleyi CCMP1516]|eukprot:XP_005766888.1 hypothetical protein EMIHUDRAFT_211931 [Emiliania huxleyi CCMP1516]
MNTILDPIIARARRSASGRVALVGSPGVQPDKIEALARVAREGVAVFVFNAGAGFEQHVNFSQHFLLKLEANLNQGGQQLGGELCRRWGSTSSAPLRLATLYSLDREADGRIDNAILGFQAGCEASEVVIVASVRLSGWTESTARRYMEAMFLADDTINAVLTTSDRHAIGAVTAANVRLPPYRARSLFVNGFGNDEFIRPYLDDDSVFATVDPMINHARKGMWRSLSTALEMASQNGWMTTADVKADVPGMEGFTLLSSSLLIPSDAEGHILSKVLGSAYNSAVVVQEISVPANTFQATFWMKTSWSDTRLEWSDEQFNGTIQVWTPNLFVQNHLSEVVERDAGETLVTVRHDGVVTWSQKVTGEFDCSPMSISPYPYDIHTCSFNITTDVEVTKVHLAGFGFSISSQPEGFALERVCNKSRCSPASVGIHEGETDMQHSAMSFAQPLVTYTFKITREPSYIITSYESGNMDRAGLAITTVLATVVLMTEGVVSKVPTWLSVFFIVCTTYQAASFLTTITAGRRFGHRAKEDAFQASQPAAKPPSATCSPSAWAKRNWPGLATWLAAILMLCEELTGREEDDMQDLFAIRILVPTFLLACITLPFLTLSMCIDADCQAEEHPEAGARSPLFLTNAILLGIWKR